MSGSSRIAIDLKELSSRKLIELARTPQAESRDDDDRLRAAVEDLIQRL